VFSVGTGLPTTAGQTATILPGLPTASGPGALSFALFDRNPGVAGLDTLYIADDRTLATGGGIQKWTFDGTTWTLVFTFGTANGLTVGARGLAGLVTGANVTLLATAASASANIVYSLIDDGSGTTTATTLATAPTNTAYRGVAFSPR